ncbi:hypothetical protein Q7P35_007859 [Cladosporium inversicolor]
MQIPKIGRIAAWPLFPSRTTADFVHSGEPLLNEQGHRAANPSDSPEIGDEPLSLSSGPRESRDVALSRLESCVDIRALDPRVHVPEHDIDSTIASLESQVDHLCSLLDDFRSEFQDKLHAFREDIQTLPDRVGVAYSPRQRAYLLGMYGKSIAESGELALQKLQHDLARLISLEDDARPRLYEEHCSPESSFVSCRSAQDSTDAISNQECDLVRRLRPFARLFQRASLPAPAPASPNASNPFIAEAAVDDDDEHATDQGEQQLLVAQPEGVALRPHREWIIDWDRFCGDCPKRTETYFCRRCSGWRRGFEDTTWDGTGSVESIDMSAKAIAR